MHLPLSHAEAPPLWTLPGDPGPSCPPWRARLHLLDDLPPGSRVTLSGGDPLRLPDLPDLLDALDARGLRADLHTDLPGLDDDLPLRRFAPYDARFVVRLPTADPARFAALTGDALARLDKALRNVRAFAWPVVIRVPVAASTVADLPETVAHALTHTVVGADLAVVTGEGDDDPRWADAPRWDALAEALRALDDRDLKPRPRLRISGVPALALPLEAITRLDLAVAGSADDAWEVPEGYRRVHGAPPRPDPDTLARRRIWLLTPPRRRPGFRGDPRDALAEATSAVLVRPGQPVHAVLLPLRDDVAPLAASARHGLYVGGRFTDPALQARFDELADLVRGHGREHPVDLARLRELAHVLRRGMAPSRDGAPVAWREEGG